MLSCHLTNPTGLQTSQDAHFYALSSRFDSFSNEGKPLVVQFTVKHEQKIDCGGGYVKIFPSGLDQADMHGDSQYYIMFGEWAGGVGDKRDHLCLRKEGLFGQSLLALLFFHCPSIVH